MKEKDLRQALVTACRDLERLGINQGTSGNISVRLDQDLLITPSAVPYDKMTPAMMARMPVAGEYGAWAGPLRPSSEWRIHLDVMRARPDVGAIIHSHALYATTLSMLHKPIQAAHYMIAAFGGATVNCTKYASFGTKELSDLAVEGLGDRNAVLLGNHGMLVTGADLDETLWRASELETLARMYFLALSVGRPFILPEEEVSRVIQRFKNYGYKPSVAAAPAAKRSKAASRKAASVRAAPKTKAKPEPRSKPAHRKPKAKPDR